MLVQILWLKFIHFARLKAYCAQAKNNLISRNLPSAWSLLRARRTKIRIIKGELWFKKGAICSLKKRNRFLRIASRLTLIGLTSKSVYLHKGSKELRVLSTSGAGAASRKKRIWSLSKKKNLAKIRPLAQSKSSFLWHPNDPDLTKPINYEPTQWIKSFL